MEGDLIIPTTHSYEVDCWTLQTGTLLAPLPPTTASQHRQEEVDIDGNITDNYLVITGHPADVDGHRSKSQALLLNAGDSLNIKFDYRTFSTFSGTPGQLPVAIVEAVMVGTGNRFYLTEDGNWELATPQYIYIQYATGDDSTAWHSKEITTDGLPGQADVYIYLENIRIGEDVNFKGLELLIRESNKKPGSIGDYDRYTIAEAASQNYEEEIFLDDSDNRTHQGALHYANALTGDRWYRMDYPAERLTFKRHKAIANMLLNRRPRFTLEVTLLGTTWDDGGTLRPLWAHSKLVFVDDAPTKVWMIVNIKELNFMENTIAATIVEIYDTAIDDMDPAHYPPHDFANIYKKDVKNF